MDKIKTFLPWEVIEYAKDLVKVEHVLKQVLNCKGD